MTPARVEEVGLAPVGRHPSPQEVAAATREAVSAVDDLAWLQPGDTVFIKPVINSGNPYPATTSPQALSAMVGLLREKGADRVVVGDMSGVEHVKLSSTGCRGSTRALAIKTGLAQAAQDAGAELSFFEEAGWDGFFEEHPASGSHWQGGLMLPKVLREADHIVLMPRCGRHALLGSTLGLKAVVGYMRFDTRLEYHHQARSIQEKTAEANTVPSLRDKLRLVVTGADKVLATYGPDKGFVSTPEQGLVIASRSLVAHDLVSLAWLLINWRQLPPRQKAFFRDPNTSQMVVNLANHFVAAMLGGLKAGLTAHTLLRDELPGVWQDRSLARACQIMGGRPRVKLLAAGQGLSPGLVDELAAQMELPAGGDALSQRVA
ncbi:MAG: DUF362 domain-containing protein [Desulfarculaceae bacterium]|nr:DUF362 domain-containing protein [Desulfarculaceae bacterium]MCF8072391.1 DUF362 domain-containing protein [Desulfarculaceae bacterium]MCF8100312.1 DUF362 domain-containing protein [Desulfarculaceae bacterium]MCF8117921.1 DUF362 domain-containing protein [Desulfarculaceae bacterium]